MSIIKSKIFQDRKQTFRVWRISDPVEGKKALIDTMVDVELDLQNLSAEDAATYDGNFSRSMKAYGAIDLDIKESDQLVGTDGVEYRVKSALDYRTIKHKKLFIQRT